MQSETCHQLDSSQRFEYSPLDKETKEIRLVQIQPSTDPAATIRLKIKHVRLSDYGTENYEYYLRGYLTSLLNDPRQAPHIYENEELSEGPEYRALSYVWGAEAASYKIYLDSDQHCGFVSVRQNLCDYLMIRRHSDEPTSWLWIDQLCIDQSDITERGHQVSSMAEIYVRATAVLIWLGRSFEGSDDAFDMLQWIGTDERFDKWYSDPKSIEYQSAVKELETRIVNNFSAIEAIMQLPYWSRLWVVQEVLLGCGVIVRLGDKVQNFKGGFCDAFGSLKRAGIIERNPCFALFWWGSGTCNWYEAFQLASSRHCSDLRDKAFGMLGLVKQEDRFYPDYSLDCQEILLKILQTNDNSIYKSRCITAMLWYSVLDPKRETIDLKVVRHHLIQLHPEAREKRLNALRNYYRPENRQQDYNKVTWWCMSLKARYWRTFLHDWTASGPTWLAQIRVRYMFPDKESIRWRHSWLRRRSCRWYPRLREVSFECDNSKSKIEDSFAVV